MSQSSVQAVGPFTDKDQEMLLKILQSSKLTFELIWLHKMQVDPDKSCRISFSGQTWIMTLSTLSFSSIILVCTKHQQTNFLVQKPLPLTCSLFTSVQILQKCALIAATWPKWNHYLPQREGTGLSLQIPTFTASNVSSLAPGWDWSGVFFWTCRANNLPGDVAARSPPAETLRGLRLLSEWVDPLFPMITEREWDRQR